MEGVLMGAELRGCGCSCGASALSTGAIVGAELVAVGVIAGGVVATGAVTTGSGGGFVACTVLAVLSPPETSTAIKMPMIATPPAIAAMSALRDERRPLSIAVDSAPI